MPTLARALSPALLCALLAVRAAPARADDDSDVHLTSGGDFFVGRVSGPILPRYAGSTSKSPPPVSVAQTFGGMLYIQGDNLRLGLGGEAFSGQGVAGDAFLIEADAHHRFSCLEPFTALDLAIGGLAPNPSVDPTSASPQIKETLDSLDGRLGLRLYLGKRFDTAVFAERSLASTVQPIREVGASFGFRFSN